MLVGLGNQLYEVRETLYGKLARCLLPARARKKGPTWEEGGLEMSLVTKKLVKNNKKYSH